jgi:Bacteriocin (Lactococcin_972)
MRHKRKRALGVGVAGLAVISGLLAGPATLAAAQEPAAATNGGSASADTPTRNGTSFPAGGTWSWGTTAKEVYSVYANTRFKHSATAQIGNGQFTRVTKKANDGAANAHRPKSLTGNKAFWNIY